MGSNEKEIIAVIHLPRLPSLEYDPGITIDQLIDQAVKEAKILDELGYSGVIIENYGDYPYQKRVTDPLTLAFMTVVVREVVRNTGLKVGVNLLRNSGREAYSMAVATGAKFIRVNALVETVITDSGMIEPEAPNLRPLILKYPGVEIYADILVKHAASLRLGLSLIESTTSITSKGLPEDYLRELLLDYVERGKASRLVITGLRTGIAPPSSLIRLVKTLSPVPVLVGSGVTPENIEQILDQCDGVIVGSWIKIEGKALNPLDPSRARELIDRVSSSYKISHRRE